jgi:DMSO/TMAO reductase YedYZ molybdopterin-dependent catalytic subunit
MPLGFPISLVVTHLLDLLLLTLLAPSGLEMEMNGTPLPVEDVAPATLRVETQLGFKMVGWVKADRVRRELHADRPGTRGWREGHDYYANAVGI